MTNYQDLIDRLEKLEGPSDDVDLSIGVSLYGLQIVPTFGMAGNWFDRVTDGVMTVDLPAFTSSIDAAIKMANRNLPESSDIVLKTYVGGKFHHCEIDAEHGLFEALNAPSPAIAICIAVLKAKEDAA